MRPILHLLLHFLVPGLAARFTTPGRRLQNWAIMLATMLIDLDHLLAHPIYDPTRCSIGFHPLHTFWPIVAYIFLCALPKTRILGAGLVIHISLDLLDCLLMQSGF